MPPAPSLRLPACAGRFYPSEPGQLRAQVERYLGEIPPPRPAFAVLAPHAGWMYSGGVAGTTFASIAVPTRVIILAPNHTGRGPNLSVMRSGTFRMPNADIPVDEVLADAVLGEVPTASADRLAHELEHAIEVELPFLHARQPNMMIMPMVMGRLSLHDGVALGQALARAVDKVGEDVLLVASSDMNHFLPDEITRKLDRLAIDKLLAVDPKGLYDTVIDNQISMCGFIPATAMLTYARALGGQSGELLSYQTSGDLRGERDRVVGYAGIVVS